MTDFKTNSWLESVKILGYKSSPSKVTLSVSGEYIVCMSTAVCLYIIELRGYLQSFHFVSPVNNWID